MATVEYNGQQYVLRGGLKQGYVHRLSESRRNVGIQKRQDDSSINRYPVSRFPLGIGYQQMNRDTGYGVGGLLDSTCWTHIHGVTLSPLEETQTHAAVADHFHKAVNFFGDLWGMFGEDFSGSADLLVCRKYGATSDDWTGGGTIFTAPFANRSPRGWDLNVHKSRLFAATNDHDNADQVYKVMSSLDGITWSDASGTGFPDAFATNSYFTQAITARNNFDDDRARLLSFGNEELIALYRDNAATNDSGGGADGDGHIAIYSTTDSGSNWVLDVEIPSGDGPKAFVDWYNLSATRSPVIIASEGVYSINTSANTFEKMHELDGNPNTGRWATVANDGRLYIGLSTGEILRLAMLDSNNLEAVTLRPGGEGLVAARRGHVNYMMPVGKYLVVAYGGHAASTNGSIFLLDITSPYRDPETGETFVPWHHMWIDGTANRDIVAMAYSTEDDGVARLHFAVEGAAASVNYHLEEPFAHPQISSTIKYQSSGYVRLPEDDMGDPHSNTLVLQGLVNAHDLSATTSGEYIQHQYGLNGAVDTTVDLGDYLSGDKDLTFGTTSGVSAKTIAHRLTLNRDAGDNTQTPHIHEFEYQAQHLYVGKQVWEFTVDIAATARSTAKPNASSDANIHETIIAALETAATSTTMVTFTAGEMAQTRVRVPNDSPPQFDIDVVDSNNNRRGYRTGFVTIRVEQGV